MANFVQLKISDYLMIISLTKSFGATPVLINFNSKLLIFVLSAEDIPGLCC